MGGFRRDPDFPALLALEHFDDDTGTATKAAIFSRRVVGARPAARQASSPAEALAISLDETGRVDLDRVGQLLNLAAQPARDGVGTPWSMTTPTAAPCTPRRATCRATSATNSSEPAPRPTPTPASRPTWPPSPPSNPTT